MVRSSTFLRSAPAVLALLAVLVPVESRAQIRMGLLTGGDVGWSGCTPRMEAKLDYMRNIGYTHVIVPTIGLTFNANGNLEPWATPASRRSELANIRNAVLARNMIPVPIVPSLTHMDAFNRVAKVPGYPALVPPRGCQPWNDACEAFNEILGDVASVWGAVRPAIICIGHDEFEHLSNPYTIAEVAEEIAARVQQIDLRWPASGGVNPVTVAIYGDSFLPNDWGEATGWVGNPSTGQGGALATVIAAAGHNVDRNRLLIIPWAYGANELWIDGARRPLDAGQTLHVTNSRISQVSYLHNLGIPFVVGTGEHGSPACTARESVESDAVIGFHLQAVHEWASAVHRVQSPWFRGFGAFVFSDFTQAGSGTSVGYTHPFVRHAENYPAHYTDKYWPGFYVAFPWRSSRQNGSFDNSMFVPPFRHSTFIGILHALQ